MFEFESIIVLITLIVLFSYMADAINIPYPIVLLLLGLGLGYLPNMPHLNIPRNILLPLFLPPILFWGALLTNWNEFRRHWLVISSLGIFLVLATSFLVAFIIDLLFPGLGFIPALLLGAIVSPSDAVCATAILSRLGLSPRIISILEGESLINDAAGIVLFNSALSMLLYNTNAFNYPVWNFFVVAVGGVVVGAVVGLLFGFIFQHLSSKKDTSLPVIVSLVIPYLVFYAGEQLEISSVLAVVSAGMCMRLIGDYKMEAHSRLRSVPVWDTFIFILNGLIFIMLGLEFPKIFTKTLSLIPMESLVELTIAVLCCIIFVRIIWVYLSAKLLRSKESWKENLLIAWSGMRGIVSLALALSIPEVEVSNTSSYHGDVLLFVTREVILFVTVITILFTVVVQGISLSWLVKRLKMTKNVEENDVQMMNVLEQLTLNTIEKIDETDFGDAKHLQDMKMYILNHYENRLRYYQISSFLTLDNNVPNKSEFKHVIFQYHRYEREQLRRLYNNGEIDMGIFSRLMHYFDMEETKYL